MKGKVVRMGNAAKTGKPNAPGERPVECPDCGQMIAAKGLRNHIGSKPCLREQERQGKRKPQGAGVSNMLTMPAGVTLADLMSNSVAMDLWKQGYREGYADAERQFRQKRTPLEGDSLAAVNG